MAKVMYVLVGFGAGLVVGTAVLVSHAESDQASAEVLAAAAEAHVTVPDLLAAMDSTQQPDPYVYLRSSGELPSLASVPAALTGRVACLERAESGGANIANRRGSGAVGVLQYMPSTFVAHAAEMGHRDWSPWNPDQARAVAAHDLALGRRGQWTVGGC